jgi:hypothetical protein
MGAAQRLRDAFAVNLSAPHSEPADTFACRRLQANETIGKATSAAH